MDIAKCITELGITGVVFNVVDGKIVSWEGETAQPTQAELETAWVSVQAKEYIDNRRNEYPDIGDQLDDLFKAGAFSTEMTATLQAVKDKYPKE